jgi:NAD(P)-dependent dehydrogenase (short-subunit alcohol dehydrogenase family)
VLSRVPDEPLAGAVCLVTGGSAGIGRASAAALAQRGAQVVIVGRDGARCAAAADGLMRSAPGATVAWIAADLSVQDQVRALADEFRARFARLDVLVNNAGTIVSPRTLTPDGIELTLAVNHLAPFLLTNLLCDRLIASAPARVINVSSVAHAQASFDLTRVQSSEGYRPYRAYATSKLCNLLFTFELARRLAGTGVTVNAVNPGLVRTGLGRGNGPVLDLAWRLTHLRYRAASQSPEQASGAIVHAATDPELESVSGRYLSDRRPQESSAASRDPDAARRLWELSEQLTGTGDAPSTPPPRPAHASS